MQALKISVQYEGLSNRQQEVFKSALDRWKSAVKGWKLPPSGQSAIAKLELRVVVTAFNSACPAGGPNNSVARVDPNNLIVLGAAAGAQSGLPQKAIIQIDQCDLDYFLTHIRDYMDIFSHEIGHALGLIGKTLDAMNLVKNVGAESWFIGLEARKEYQKLLAQRNGSNPSLPEGVPIHPSRDHWDDTVFSGELMTSHGTGQQVPFQRLSALTLAALRDIGYVIKMDEHEGYRLP